MRHSALSTLLILVASGVCADGRAEDVMRKVLDYPPSEAVLTGRLTHRVFPGPPNYSSVKRGDAAESAFILLLDHPVEVRAGAKDPDFYPAHKNVRTMHVAIDLDDDEERIALQRLLTSLIGRDVVIRAELMPGHTGHHRTDVLGFAKQIKRKGAKDFAPLVLRTEQEKERDEARAADQAEAELKRAGIFSGKGPLLIDPSLDHGKRVRLEGELVKRKVPAPSPNSMWVKDDVQTVWLLRLDAPVSIRPLKNSDASEHAVDDVRELDLTIWFDDPLVRRNFRALGVEPVDDPDAAVYESLFGRRLRLTGWLTNAHRPNAPARLMVERIEAAQSPASAR